YQIFPSTTTIWFWYISTSRLLDKSSLRLQHRQNKPNSLAYVCGYCDMLINILPTSTLSDPGSLQSEAGAAAVAAHTVVKINRKTSSKICCGTSMATGF